MQPRFWSFRMFAALWGMLLAPLAPSLADEHAIERLLPADTLAYIAWAQPYNQDDPELEQLKRLVRQMAGADLGDPGRTGIGKLMRLLELALQYPGGLSLLDVTATAQAPDIQAVLLIAAEDDSAALADGLADFIGSVAPDAEIASTELRGVSMRRVASPEVPLVICWGTYAGHFVMTLGERAAERVIAGMSAAGGPSLADSAEIAFAQSKLGPMEGEWRVSAFGDARALVTKIRALVEQLHGPLPPVVDKVIEALGINGVRSKYFRATMTPDHGLLGRLFVHLEGERKGILRLWSQQPLTEEDLEIIPKDAYWAQVCNLDLKQLWEDTRQTIDEVDPNAVPMVEGMLAAADAMLGVSITEQLLPAFGDTWAAFDAPSHGGVLLTGAVLVVEARDADAIQAAMTRLVGMLKPILASKDVNLALGQTACDGRMIHYALIGGVPCPVAPAWTFVNDRMVFGLFPQTVAAAAKQVDPQTRGESILALAEVKDARRNVFPSHFQSFGCSDAKYFARLLYPLGLLYATAGISAFSVPGVELDPMAYPMLADVVKDAHYSVGMCATDGDGIHYAQVGSANAGLMAVAVTALLVSILLPSLSRARELAKRAVSASNLRGIGQACYIYANDHDERFPESLEALIDKQFLTREMLNSPRDDEGGISYVYIRGQSQADDPRNVIAYEKILDDEGTNVLFLDGHVEWMKLDAFKQALTETYQRLGREDELSPDLRDLQP
jgi:prepilin-type processing-associated H-X9-DG protein